VVDAYSQLAAEGFLVTRPGSATVVTDAVRITPAHVSWLQRHREPASRLWRPELDLRPAGPDLALLPRSQGVRTMTDIFRHLPAAEFGYTGPWGPARLRRQLAAHLGRVRAAMAPADGIVVVTGGTQALTIIARTLAAAGHDRIAVEDPGAPMHRHLLQAHGLKTIPVPVDAEGLAVDVLVATGCQVVLVSPSHQFPTGAVMSAERRARLLEWAETHSALIIGLGWIVPPPSLLRAIAETKRDDDFGTGMMEQHALASWLESGQYDRHVRRSRRAYATRRAELSRQLHQHFPGWLQHGSTAGLEILLELPGSIAERHVVAHARQLGLGLSPLGPMRIRPAGPPGLVLSYARLPPRHCTEAVARLKLAVEAVLAENRSLTAAAIPSDSDEPWRLTSADWPAATEDFYAF
jgi:GntR family transcriptional regulator/MocR family aminotransferase